eukprot:gene567-3884_t
MASVVTSPAPAPPQVPHGFFSPRKRSKAAATPITPRNGTFSSSERSNLERKPSRVKKSVSRRTAKAARGKDCLIRSFSQLQAHHIHFEETQPQKTNTPRRDALQNLSLIFHQSRRFGIPSSSIKAAQCAQVFREHCSLKVDDTVDVPTHGNGVHMQYSRDWEVGTLAVCSDGYCHIFRDSVTKLEPYAQEVKLDHETAFDMAWVWGRPAILFASQNQCKMINLHRIDRPIYFSSKTFASIRTLDTDPTCHHVFACGTSEGGIQSWDDRVSGGVSYLNTYKHYTKPFRQFHLSPQNEFNDQRTAGPMHSMRSNVITKLKYHHDGIHMATSSMSNGVLLWDRRKPYSISSNSPTPLYSVRPNNPARAITWFDYDNHGRRLLISSMNNDLVLCQNMSTADNFQSSYLKESRQLGRASTTFDPFGEFVLQSRPDAGIIACWQSCAPSTAPTSCAISVRQTIPAPVGNLRLAMFQENGCLSIGSCIDHSPSSVFSYLFIPLPFKLLLVALPEANRKNMPGIVKVHVHEARDLPVMDSSTQLTDAYVEMKFNNKTMRTQTAKKTLNPMWNEDFRFEVDDEDIQDEMLEVNVWDHDRIGTDDVIGQVLIDLLPLGPYNGSQISGWFPIYDTLKGVRGSLAITIKLDLFKNHHKYRDTSVGVTFFSTMAIPRCYEIVTICGLVEELMVKDDPEYQWIDRVRPTRQSNQARQNIFTTLTGELQRRIGVKANDLKANAVIGYRQLFDLEGESGLVARGIGTAAIITDAVDSVAGGSTSVFAPSTKRTENTSLRQSPQKHLQHGLPSTAPADSGLPLITLCTIPKSSLISIGGVVTARAVKLLDKMENPDETDTRDVWWSELRAEVLGHAFSLGYSAVIGYSETASINNNLCLLSATGTSAILNTDPSTGVAFGIPTQHAAILRRMSNADGAIHESPANPISHEDIQHCRTKSDESFRILSPPCAPYHTPQSMAAETGSESFAICEVCCSTNTVPDVLFTTIDPPHTAPLLGSATFIQARVCRIRQKKHGSYEDAAELAEGIPFLEYALHQQLYHKLRILAMNSIFNLRVAITIGTNLCVAIATATAANLACLPLPPELQILRKTMGISSADIDAIEKTRALMQKMAENRTFMNAEKAKEPYQQYTTSHIHLPTQSFTSSAMLQPDRRTAIVEVDDAVDSDDVASLWDAELPEGFFVSSTGVVPGLEFTHRYTPTRVVDQVMSVTRTIINTKAPVNNQLAQIFDQLLTAIWFKVREHKPCIIANLRWSVTLPEDFEVQVLVTASIIKLNLIKERKFTSVSSAEWENIVARQGISSIMLDYKAAEKRHIVVTSLDAVPESNPVKHLGPVVLYLIKETTTLRDTGGLSGFVQRFIQEVLGIARAHVRSRGGNALVGCRIKHLDILDHTQKNQAQCLIAFQGDALLFADLNEMGADDKDDDRFDWLSNQIRRSPVAAADNFKTLPSCTGNDAQEQPNKSAPTNPVQTVNLAHSESYEINGSRISFV